MHRVVIPELLDTDTGTPREIEDSLSDLRMINRYCGGLRTMAQLLLRVAKERGLTKMTWLDVGGGRGDVAVLTSKSLRKHGIELEPVLLDRMPSHMVPRTTTDTPHVNGFYPAIGGDALALPFKDNSFDVVGCSLFVHHLDPEQVVGFARQALRITRHAFLINDLVRHRLHMTLAYAGYPLYRSPITRHDSIASVRRAYTLKEIQNMLRQTDATKIDAGRFFLFRMGVIAWKKPSLT